MKKLLFIVLCFCVLVGCTTTHKTTFGTDFDASQKEKIVKGQSTKEDVQNLYGDPADKTLDDKYNEKWIYLYTYTDNEINLWDYGAKATTTTKKLEIAFDQDGKVINYIFSNTSNPASLER